MAFRFDFMDKEKELKAISKDELQHYLCAFNQKYGIVGKNPTAAYKEFCAFLKENDFLPIEIGISFGTCERLATQEQKEYAKTADFFGYTRQKRVLEGNTMPNITLMQGDCLELMKQLPDKSVDMVLCDLPYGCLNKNNPNTKWDSIIPFGSIWSEYCRIAKENAAIVLFGSGMFTADLMQSNRKMWRYNIVWDKVAKTGFLNAKKMPLRRHEDICVFYRKTPLYNPQMEKCPPHKRNHSKGNMKSPTKNRCYGNFVETPTIVSDEKYPTSIVSISKEHCNGKFFHPTQKPVQLLEWLIKTYTNEGETVLDNCMGSGSTGVACVNTNRNFIGMELDPQYFEIAKKRIEDAERMGIQCEI